MVFYSVLAGSRLNPSTIWGHVYFITIPCYNLYSFVLCSHLKEEIGLNGILLEDDKCWLNLSVLGADKWNNRKIQSSICSMIMFVYEDLYTWMPV